MKLKAVIFDLDGTLVDTTEFVYQAYEYALFIHGLPAVDRKILSPLIGRSLEMIYQEIAPQGDVAVLMEEHMSFQKQNLSLVKSYPNIKKVLDSLKKLGLKIGIVTSRYKNTSQTLAAVGIKNNFDVVITGDDVVKSKPDPECLFLALRKLKVKPEEVILVGDAAVDIEIGKMVGIKTVGVTYGFGGKEITKSKPDYVIDEIGQLLEILYL